MKKTIKLLSVLLLTSGMAAAQDTPAKLVADGMQSALSLTQAPDSLSWFHKGMAGVNMSQAAFSNWSAGGDPSMAFDAMFTYDLNYKRGRNLWTNRLELGYGLNDTRSNGTRKTNDKIFFSSNYGYELRKNLYLGAMLSFNTQFDKGYNYTNTPRPNVKTDYISKFMSPGYLTAGLGVIWTPKTWFKLTFAPLSWRATFVTDDRLSSYGAFGLDKGKHMLTQFGADLVAEVRTNVWHNMSFYSRLELYSNYLKNPQNIIIHWDNQLLMKVNPWLSASLVFNLIYDDNIHFAVPDGDGTRYVAKLQIKEVLGIGLQATF